MAFPTPDVTIIDFSGTPTNVGLASALYAHWVSGGASTKFTATDPYTATGGGVGSFSFRMTPDAGGETWQANFRSGTTFPTASTTNGFFSIEPTASITNSSDLTGASAQFSGEPTGPVTYYDVGGDTSSTVYILEWDDAFMLLFESSDDSYFPYGCHVGRCFSGLLQSRIDDGMSGLAVIGHIPYWSTGSVSGGWLSAAASTNKFQMGTTEWADGGSVTWLTTLATTVYLGSDNSRKEPIPTTLSRQTVAGAVGVMKYMYHWSPSDTPKTRLADTGITVRYMYAFSSYVVTSQIVPWDTSTIP